MDKEAKGFAAAEFITSGTGGITQRTVFKPMTREPDDDGWTTYETRKKTAADYLMEGVETYNERNKLYGDNYHHFGTVMEGLFPDGITLKTKDDFNRFGVIVQIVSKISRICGNFGSGGHADSAHDLSVYAAMLRELEQ